MQSELEDGSQLYTEYADSSGFIVREIHKTLNPVLKYQVGRYKHRNMSLPVYQVDRMTHHVQGDEIRVFHMLAFSDTLGKALDKASNLIFKKELQQKHTTP